MQSAIVAIIVSLAVLYVVLRLRRDAKSGSCGSCGGSCSRNANKTVAARQEEKAELPCCCGKK